MMVMNAQKKKEVGVRGSIGVLRELDRCLDGMTLDVQAEEARGAPSGTVLEEIDHGNRPTPLVLKGRVEAWPARAWSPSSLAHGPLGGVRTVFRFARRSATGIVREGNCHYQELSLRDFFDWMQGSAGNDGVSASDAQLAQCGGPARKRPRRTAAPLDAHGDASASGTRGTRGQECARPGRDEELPVESRLGRKGGRSGENDALTTEEGAARDARRRAVEAALGGRTASEWWGYADYKRFHDIFADDPGKGSKFVDWAALGLPAGAPDRGERPPRCAEDREKEAATEADQEEEAPAERESTFWFGSAGSQVPRL